MKEEITIQKSLVEQILDEMFVQLEGRVEFDTTTTQRLRQLTISGNLSKVTQVTEAVKAASEGT